jgi:hypothetical protein
MLGCWERLTVGGFRVRPDRSALPGESRPAHRTRQRRQLHALVVRHISLCCVKLHVKSHKVLLLGKRIFLIVPSLAPCHPERQRRVPVEMLRCAQHDMTLGCLKVSASLTLFLAQISLIQTVS